MVLFYYGRNSGCQSYRGCEGIFHLGKAGKQTVTIGISDEGQDYDNTTVASITISMNGQEAVLAEVTRNAAGRTFKLYKKVQAMNGWKYRQKKVSKPDTMISITYKVVANSVCSKPTVRNG